MLNRHSRIRATWWVYLRSPLIVGRRAVAQQEAQRGHAARLHREVDRWRAVVGQVPDPRARIDGGAHLVTDRGGGVAQREIRVRRTEGYRVVSRSEAEGIPAYPSIPPGLGFPNPNLNRRYRFVSRSEGATTATSTIQRSFARATPRSARQDRRRVASCHRWRWRCH